MKPAKHPYTLEATVQGIYIAYFSGWNGNSIGVFILQQQRILGVDSGGVQYAGRYSTDDSGGCIDASIVARFDQVPAADQVAAELSNAVLRLPDNFCDGGMHPLTTPVGEITCSFERVLTL